MLLLAFAVVDLFAFVALALAVGLVAVVLVGLGRWLRDRKRTPGEAGYYPGL